MSAGRWPATNTGSQTPPKPSFNLKSKLPNAFTIAKPTPPVEWGKPPSMAYNMDSYEKLNQVGEGTYGKVYKAKCKKSGDIVALKRIRIEQEKDGFPITAIREIRILLSLRHKNVIRLLEIISETSNTSSPCISMVLEYMDHDLTGVLSSGLTFTPAHIKCLIKQMFEGLGHLHDQGIIHRDMKGSNLLLNAKGELKLADFGLARNLYSGSNGAISSKKMDHTNRVITLWYRSPELLLGTTKYCFEVDLWSAGCIILELLDGEATFRGTNELEQIDSIFRLCGTPEKSWPDVINMPWWSLMRPRNAIPRSLKQRYKSMLTIHFMDLIDQLLQLDPKKRPTCAQVLKHLYIMEEKPAACLPADLPKIEGDWHEFESKMRKKQGKLKCDIPLPAPPLEEHIVSAPNSTFTPARRDSGALSAQFERESRMSYGSNSQGASASPFIDKPTTTSNTMRPPPSVNKANIPPPALLKSLPPPPRSKYDNETYGTGNSSYHANRSSISSRSQYSTSTNEPSRVAERNASYSDYKSNRSKVDNESRDRHDTRKHSTSPKSHESDAVWEEQKPTRIPNSKGAIDHKISTSKYRRKSFSSSSSSSSSDDSVTRRRIGLKPKSFPSRRSPIPSSSRKRSLSPYPLAKRSPSLMQTRKRTADTFVAPKRSQSPLPARRRSPSPINARWRALSPVGNRGRSPSPTSLRKRSVSPMQYSKKRSRSPLLQRRRSRSPNRARSKSPPLQRHGNYQHRNVESYPGPVAKRDSYIRPSDDYSAPSDREYPARRSNYDQFDNTRNQSRAWVAPKDRYDNYNNRQPQQQQQPHVKNFTRNTNGNWGSNYQASHREGDWNSRRDVDNSSWNSGRDHDYSRNHRVENQNDRQSYKRTDRQENERKPEQHFNRREDYDRNRERDGSRVENHDVRRNHSRDNLDSQHRDHDDFKASGPKSHHDRDSNDNTYERRRDEDLYQLKDEYSSQNDRKRVVDNTSNNSSPRKKIRKHEDEDLASLKRSPSGKEYDRQAMDSFKNSPPAAERAHTSFNDRAIKSTRRSSDDPPGSAEEGELLDYARDTSIELLEPSSRRTRESSEGEEEDIIEEDHGSVVPGVSFADGGHVNVDSIINRSGNVVCVKTLRMKRL